VFSAPLTPKIIDIHRVHLDPNHIFRAQAAVLQILNMQNLTWFAVANDRWRFRRGRNRSPCSAIFMVACLKRFVRSGQADHQIGMVSDNF